MIRTEETLKIKNEQPRSEYQFQVNQMYEMFRTIGLAAWEENNLAKGDGMTEGLKRYVGTYVTTKVAIPSDRRGETIFAGTDLFVLEMVGTEHFNLNWPAGSRAANQVHYSKLMTL